MIYYVGFEEYSGKNRSKTAGAKAPNDIKALCKARGYTFMPVKAITAQKLKAVQKVMAGIGFWKNVLKTLQKGDVLIYQHPMYIGYLGSRYMDAIQKKGIRIVAVIHDLESLRRGIEGEMANSEKKNNVMENLFLKRCDVVICHNPIMKHYLVKKGFSEKNTITLGIFDYLIPNGFTERSREKSNEVTIAGHRAEGKSGYIYKMIESIGDSNLKLHLFGVKFNEEKMTEQVQYHGAFSPDEVPNRLEGAFGVVWDGSEASTCAGNTGEYLRYNNPHKASLYLASGLPVVVWSQAAVARFVEQHKVGISVASLADLSSAINQLTDEEYHQILENVRRVGKWIREGHYFNEAMDQALQLLEVSQ